MQGERASLERSEGRKQSRKLWGGCGEAGVQAGERPGVERWRSGGRQTSPLKDVPQEALVRQRRAHGWAGAGAGPGARAVGIGGHGPTGEERLGSRRRH